MTQPEPFFSTLYEPLPLRLRVSARVLAADDRHAEVVQLLTADEVQRAVYDRVLDIGDPEELRNGLASFLASEAPPGHGAS